LGKPRTTIPILVELQDFQNSWSYFAFIIVVITFFPTLNGTVYRRKYFVQITEYLTNITKIKSFVGNLPENFIIIRQVSLHRFYESDNHFSGFFLAFKR